VIGRPPVWINHHDLAAESPNTQPRVTPVGGTQDGGSGP
jgi:hypothetical protein